MGRFITEDPARDGLNWYVYCGNNPVNYIDPWGLWDSMGKDQQFKNNNPIVYSALDDLTKSWNNLDLLEKQGINIGNMKVEVAELANEVREIGYSMVVLEPSLIGSRMNYVEKVLYAKYSPQGQTFLSEGVLARLKTEERYGNGYRVGDDSDAFRHAYWNATLANKIGSAIAKLYTDAHEYGFPENFNNDNYLNTNMDLYNNKQGREIGSRVSKNNINRLIIEAVKTGKLKKIVNNNLIPTNDGAMFLPMYK